MQLAPEDSLRLNVLLANKPQAIRINESQMTVFGLSEQGEAKVNLNPTCRDEQYIKLVKELISGHVLGSPGGYPVYLQRWTRMGQMKDDSLEQLLMLGEPEAIVAAVHAPGLTDELARRAWWAMEDAENARQMLRKQAVCEGQMGPLLAEYLVEHLPFEVEPEKQIETIRLVLQPGLLNDEQIDSLWRKAGRKPPFYVGFIATLPDNLPEQHEAHELHTSHSAELAALAQQGNRAAQVLARVLGEPGQGYMQTLFGIFKKPSNQDVINMTLDQISDYFSPVREERVDLTLEELSAEAESWMSHHADAQAVIALNDAFGEKLQAIRVLSGLSYGVVRPVFKGSTAIGSLMRKKLAPVLEPLQEHMAVITAHPPKH